MTKTKEVWDYTYPDCPKLELWHKYLVKQKMQGKEGENCGDYLMKYTKYCPGCGRKVKWDD